MRHVASGSGMLRGLGRAATAILAMASLWCLAMASLSCGGPSTPPPSASAPAVTAVGVTLSNIRELRYTTSGGTEWAQAAASASATAEQLPNSSKYRVLLNDPIPAHDRHVYSAAVHWKVPDVDVSPDLRLTNAVPIEGTLPSGQHQLLGFDMEPVTRSAGSPAPALADPEPPSATLTLMITETVTAQDGGTKYHSVPWDTNDTTCPAFLSLTVQGSPAHLATAAKHWSLANVTLGNGTECRAVGYREQVALKGDAHVLLGFDMEPVTTDVPTPPAGD